MRFSRNAAPFIFTAAILAFPALASSALAAEDAAGADSASSSLTPSQRAEMKKVVREAIMENPEMIMEAVNLLRERQENMALAQQKEMIAQHHAALFEAPGDPVLGNPKGDITVIEFVDYQCGYCKQIFGPLMTTLKENKRVRLVMKDFPVLGPASVIGAKYALAAHKQGKYNEFHTALMGLRGPVTDKALQEVAGRVGLSLPRLEKEIESEEITRALSETMELGQKLGLRGTPAFIVGDQIIAGADFDALVKAIKDAENKTAKDTESKPGHP